MSLTPDAPCARCGRWLTAAESMVRKVGREEWIVCRWGLVNGCSGEWPG